MILSQISCALRVFMIMNGFNLSFSTCMAHMYSLLVFLFWLPFLRPLIKAWMFWPSCRTLHLISTSIYQPYGTNGFHFCNIILSKLRWVIIRSLTQATIFSPPQLASSLLDSAATAQLVKVGPAVVKSTQPKHNQDCLNVNTYDRYGLLPSSSP